MNSFFRSLFYTNKATIGKDLFGNPIVAEGLFLSWFGRNFPYLVIGFIVTLVLIVTWLRYA